MVFCQRKIFVVRKFLAISEKSAKNVLVQTSLFRYLPSLLVCTIHKVYFSLLIISGQGKTDDEYQC